MKFILFIFIFQLVPGGQTAIMHKSFQSKQACEDAMKQAKEKMPLPANSSAAAICISEKDLLEYNLT